LSYAITDRRQNVKRMLLLLAGLTALLVPAGAASAHPPRIAFGAQWTFQPAAGYPTPPYPTIVRRTKFSPQEWCWGAQLYDAATGTYGPYSPSLTPPIFPAPPGLDGGDQCVDPTQETYAVVGASRRGPNLYGTFGPVTTVYGMKIDRAARKLRLNLPDGSVVPLPFVKGTFLWMTNSQLGPITLTYRVDGVDVTTPQF
jgi:hypothetical protein